MTEAKQPKWRKLAYAEDLVNKREFKVTFTGPWNRAQVDRVYKLLLRELRLHKHNLRRKDEDERRSEQK